MVSLTALWLPIVLSAVIVFFASFVVHMVLTYHRSDYSKLAGEDDVLEAMRKAGVTPGSYYFPYAVTPKDMGTPEMKEKLDRGPVGFMTVMPNGPPVMAKNMAFWFGFCLLISIFAAYLAGRTLGAGSEYLAVFRVVGAVAFLGYAGAEISDSIWKSQSWATTAKNMFDGLVYGLLTAGTFAWLWP